MSASQMSGMAGAQLGRGRAAPTPAPCHCCYQSQENQLSTSSGLGLGLIPAVEAKGAWGGTLGSNPKKASKVGGWEPAVGVQLSAA